MIRHSLERLRFIHNGKVDWERTALWGVPILAFFIWRFSGGVYGSEQILNALEREIIAEYKEALYAEYGMYDKNAASTERAKHFPSEEVIGLDVAFDNVSMSASLFGWDAKSNVGLRYDYTLTKDGEFRRRRTDVYKLVQRRHGTKFWDSGVVSYYLQYF
ncbi:MAG: hypothetical protein AAF493_15200 [Pseudomonadota bacterium]